MVSAKKLKTMAMKLPCTSFITIFVKQHKTLRTTPAMEAGLMKGFMSIEDIVKLVPEPVQGKRGSYKKKVTAE
jgi:hypothetical protein